MVLNKERNINIKIMDELELNIKISDLLDEWAKKRNAHKIILKWYEVD